MLILDWFKKREFGLQREISCFCILQRCGPALLVGKLHSFRFWVLDTCCYAGEAYDQVTEMCIYLLNELSIPPHKAVAVYIQSPYSTFQFRGAVYSSCPSAVLSLLWPNSSQMHLTESASPPITAKIGLAIEDLATLPTLNVGHCHKIEEVAMKVGQNLFNFMQSSCSVQGTQLAVPRGLFEQWFKRFEERSKRDSEYLKHVLV
jgi:hypothetical protein